MKKYSDFTYWFIRTGFSDFKVVITADSTSVTNSKIYLHDGDIAEINKKDLPQEIKNKILSDFADYKNARPEYWVGSKIYIENFNLEELKEIYMNLLKGIALIRVAEIQGYNAIAGYENKLNVFDSIRNTDFFTAPASTKYHNAYTGGLLIHTLNVYNRILELSELPQFNHIKYHSMALVALTHAWCRIGLYESYYKNVKDEYGNWKQVEAFRKVEPPVPLGYGESSLYMAQKYFKLNLEETLAIRWYGGKYYCDSTLDDMLNTAERNYPLVNMLQFAVQLSVANY